MRIAHLLAAGLEAGIGRIGDGDHDFLGTRRAKGARDIEGEGVITAAVGTDLLTVDIHGGLPIDSTEVELNGLIAPAGGALEGASIP
jgi:hypothetical protein